MEKKIAELHLSVHKLHTTRNSSIRTDKGLTLGTSAFFFSLSLWWPANSHLFTNPVDKTRLPEHVHVISSPLVVYKYH